MHKTLKNWRARRAGGRITVYGEHHETGQLEKITNVDTIEPWFGACRATDKAGVEHRLLT